MIKGYNAQYAGDELYVLGLTSLTWEGHDYLDKIRSDTVWNKTKSVISQNGLPFIIDTVKDIASGIIRASVQGAIAGLK